LIFTRKAYIQNIYDEIERSIREKVGRSEAHTLGLLGPPRGHGIGLRS
jgi:hypothetical protein